MTYTQFFRYSSQGALVEPCGDRSVIILDGRMSRENCRIVSREECLKRGFVAYRIMSGTFLKSNPESDLYIVKGFAA